MKILFICSANIDRSPTAEKTIHESYPDIETKSAGVLCDACQRVNKELIQWADVVLCMESYHKAKLQEMFNNMLEDKKLSCLHIPDRYRYMHPDLVSMIKERFDQWLNENI
jgi:predicted protein tyrosine phosphatase